MCVYKKENHIAGRNEQFAKIISKKERKKGNFMKFPNEKNTTYVRVVTMTKRKKIPVATKKKEKDYCDYYSCSVLVVFFIPVYSNSIVSEYFLIHFFCCCLP